MGGEGLLLVFYPLWVAKRIVDYLNTSHEWNSFILIFFSECVETNFTGFDGRPRVLVSVHA